MFADSRLAQRKEPEAAPAFMDRTVGNSVQKLDLSEAARRSVLIVRDSYRDLADRPSSA